MGFSFFTKPHIYTASFLYVKSVIKHAANSVL